MVVTPRREGEVVGAAGEVRETKGRRWVTGGTLLLLLFHVSFSGRREKDIPVGFFQRGYRISRSKNNMVPNRRL